MSEIRRGFLRGVSWSFGSNILSQVLNLMVTIILARLLSPSEFGIVGMVTVFSGFAKSLIDFGLGNALIFKDEVTELDRSTVFWTNFAISLFMTTLFISLPGSIAVFYKNEELQLITLILSFNFLISAFSVVNHSIIRKKLDFKTEFIIGLSSLVISGLVALLLAYAGWGYWALVAQIIVSSFLNALLGIYFIRWLPKMIYSLDALKQLMRFSWGLVGNNTLNYWVRNIDNLLIGKYVGTAELGIYSKSYSLLTLPMRSISDVVSKVLFPSFTMIKQKPEKIRSIYFKVCQAIMLIVAPLMTFLFVETDYLIALVLGDKWLSMVPVVKVFCVLSINQSIGTLISNLYMAFNKTREMFYVGTFLRIMLITAIVIGLQWGIMGVAISYTIAGYLSSSIYHTHVGKIAGFKLQDFIKNVVPIVLMNVGIGILIFLLRLFLEDQVLPIYVLIASSVFYVAIYYLLLEKFRLPVYLELKSLVLNYSNKPR